MRERLEKIWGDLAGSVAAAGVLKRLLDVDWPGQLSAVVLKPGNEPGLLLELSAPVQIDLDSLAVSESVDLLTGGDDSGMKSILVTLKDAKYRDTFATLAADLADHVLATEVEQDGAITLVRHLDRWLRFMKRRSFGVMSRESQLGLYGELSVLCNVIAPSVGFEAASRAWEGPAGAYQDFQLGSVVIEVKAISATRPQQLHISSERQLDDHGIDALIVAHLEVSELQDAGISLPDLVGIVREGLGPVGPEVEVFEDRLFESGYLDSHAHLYAHVGFVERSTRFYRARSGFPRIVEGDLRPGVGAVRYKIDASACASFEVGIDQLSQWINSSPPVLDAISEEESLHVEHKASAWKSLTPEIPDKVINEAVVKTVAGFLNADGGTLVIGVEDRTGHILGVELDLEHLGIDLDAYQNRLATMLATCLGGSAAARVRIGFEVRGGLTLCLLRVLPSARAVLANPPTGKKNVFWVRIGNSTRELPLDQALDYIRDHWG